MIRLAVPLCLVQIGYNLMGFVDTALAGRVDEHTLSAAGLGSQVFFAVSVVGFGICMGIDPLVSQAFGAGKLERAHTVMRQGFYVALWICLPLTLLVVLLAQNLEALGIAPRLAQDTRAFVYPRVLSLAPMLMGVILRSYFQASHVLRPILWSVLFSNIFNFAADWILLFGDAGLERLGLPGIGLPSFGVAGLGWASTLATIAQLAMMLVALHRLDLEQTADLTPSVARIQTPNRYRRPHYRPAWAVQRQIIQVGLPVGLHLLAEVGVFALVGLLAARIGTLAMASHQVALSLSSMAFSLCLGIGAATSVQVGRAIGREDAEGTRRAGFCGFITCGLIMSVSACFMWCAPEPLARLMTSDMAVVTAAAPLVAIAGLFQIVDGLQAVGAGALRGAGLTPYTFWTNLIGHWVVGLPMGAYLAFGRGQAVSGLWLGLTIGLASVAFVLTIKFVRVSRRQIAALA